MRVINPCVNDVAAHTEQRVLQCGRTSQHWLQPLPLDRDGCEVLCSLQHLGHNASVAKKDSMQLTEVMSIDTCKNVCTCVCVCAHVCVCVCVSNSVLQDWELGDQVWANRVVLLTANSCKT